MVVIDVSKENLPHALRMLAKALSIISDNVEKRSFNEREDPSKLTALQRAVEEAEDL